MSTRLKNLGLALGLVVAGSAFCASSAIAATTLKIGWATSDTETDPHAIMARYFVEALDEIAPDAFEVRLYPNNQLGNENELLQAQQLGTLDMSLVAGSSASEIAPAFQLNDLPFLYDSEEQAFEVLDGKAGELLFEQLQSKGIIGLGFLNAGFRNVLNNKRPITSPEDLSGVKLRVVPSDIFIDIFKALNANPSPMQWSDVYTAVQQKTIDGLEVPLSVAYGNKFQEVVKYLSLTQHIFNSPIFTMSEMKFNQLSDEEQGFVTQAAEQALAKQRQTVSDNNATILEQMKAAGVEVNDIEDRSEFQAQTESLYDKYRDVIGAEVIDAALNP